MVKHIGIVACSAEGASLCYRTICTEGAHFLGGYGHPEVSMHTHSLDDYMQCIHRADWAAVANLMLASTTKLASIGAELVVCPDNTLHQALPLIVHKSPIPWLHIADAVAQEASRRGWRRVGLTGTRWLVDSEVYPDALRERRIDYVRPGVAERDEVSRIIMEELVRGVFKAESLLFLQRLIMTLKTQGCDSVVLGCTELPLILSDDNSALPVLDSTRLLARAALNRAIPTPSARL